MIDIDDHTFDLELTEQILEFLSNNPKPTILTISKSCNIDSYQCSRYLDFMESWNLVESNTSLDGIRTIIITASGINYLKAKDKAEKEPFIQEKRADKIEEISYNLLHRYPFQINSKAHSTLDVYLSKEWQDANETIRNYCTEIEECSDEDIELVKKLMIELLEDDAF